MNHLGGEKSSPIPIVIITYKDLFLWAARYKSVSDVDYERRAAQISLSADDLKSLGIDDSAQVRLANEFGSIVVQAKLDPRCPKGFGFMPRSRLTNRLTNYDPTRAKNPNFKRIEVTVEPVS